MASDLASIFDTQAAHLSASTVILFDHLITLDDEVHLIWQGSLSPGKLLFISNRYYVLALIMFDLYATLSPAVTDSVSFRFYVWQGWSGIAVSLTAQAILLLRICALYSYNRIVIALSIFMLVVAFSIPAWVLITGLSRFGAIATSVKGVNGRYCEANLSHPFFALWIPSLTVESILMLMAVGRGIYIRRSLSPFKIHRTAQHIVDILIHDSVLYFVAIAGAYILCIITWHYGTVRMLQIPVGFSVALPCVMSNRLLLNMHKMRTPPEEGHPLTLTGNPTSPSFNFGVSQQPQDAVERVGTRSNIY
ncbi:hypothetical protein CPC08DRAFT_710157 [Agrocybe pediades]|nr:hypothetical protein CPC08DRAFT_710157 [Agrocybe pediades]